MRTVIVKVIDSAIGCFQRVIELQSTHINAKSSKKLRTIGIQFGPTPNCESIRYQVFRPKMEASRGFWQIDNLVFDIDRKGRNMLMEDAIGKTTCYFDGHLIVSNSTAEVSGCDTVAERARFVMSEKSDIGTGETACTRMISEAIRIHTSTHAEANGTEIMTVGEGKSVRIVVK